jgi:UPF0755 protein
MRGDIIPPRRTLADNRPVRPSIPIQARRDKRTDEPATAPDEPPAEVKQDIDLSEFTPQHDEPTPKRRRKPILIVAVTVIALFTVMIAGLIIWYQTQLAAVSPGSDEKVKVTVQPGSGVKTIAEQLKRSGLIRSDVGFDWYIRLNGKSAQLQSGTYRLGKGEDVPTIVGHLTSGTTDTFSITFLPGATLEKHRQTLIDTGYDAARVDEALAKRYDHPVFAGKPASADLEGYIYGETYNFPADASVEDILIRSFDELEAVVAGNDLVSRYKQQGFSLYQGITMASIIQREVITAQDAAQVAQVFKKRYDMDMPLGSDVTYQYIADKTGQARSVDIDSPYNTRRYPGLPPGPISSPGLAALKAVGSPAPGDYLYFLSGDDDKTYFARTNEEHERNIRDHCQEKCQII